MGIWPVVECSVSYNGGPWQFGVQLLDFRDDLVARERIYVMEGWEAAEWRKPWRSTTNADDPDELTESGLISALTAPEIGAGASMHRCQQSRYANASHRDCRRATVGLLSG
jgi:hypothetical protein